MGIHQSRHQEGKLDPYQAFKRVKGLRNYVCKETVKFNEDEVL
jgi:hypothetical protein